MQGSRLVPKQGPHAGCEGPHTMGATSLLTQASAVPTGCVAGTLAFCLLRALGRAAPWELLSGKTPSPLPSARFLWVSGRGLCLVLVPVRCFEVSVEWKGPPVVPTLQTKLPQSGSGSLCGWSPSANVAASNE